MDENDPIEKVKSAGLMAGMVGLYVLWTILPLAIIGFFAAFFLRSCF